jgi:ribosomal protein L37AE/L43A
MWKCEKCGREFKNTNQDHYDKPIDYNLIAEIVQYKEHFPKLG